MKDRVDRRCYLGLHDFDWIPHPAPVDGVVEQMRQVRCTRGCMARLPRLCRADEHAKHPDPYRVAAG